MITPRRTRLLRAPDLAGFRARLIDCCRGLDPERAADTFILVPTRAAGEQLRRTLEDQIENSLFLPRIGTRADFYDALADRLADPPRLLTGIERDVLMASAARDAEDAGLPAPFVVRPALVAEMVSLYDHVRRQDRTIDDFERLLAEELTGAAEHDRGAQQLLDQTRFLDATYRGYEARLADSPAVDEHQLRTVVLAETARRPLRHVVVTVGDRLTDSAGLWPADAALLTTVSGLEQIDVVATDSVLNAGYLDRLRMAMVGIEEIDGGAAAPPPTLRVPRSSASASASPAFEYRDREDELEGVARRVKSTVGKLSPIHRHALVVARPLPYLYLARAVFSSAGIPFESLDTLPLAAEPYAAAVDLVIEFVTSDFTRGSMTALLRSPHFTFTADGAAITGAAVLEADHALVERRYLGGIERLEPLSALPAVRAAIDAAAELSPLLEPHPLAEQFERMTRFLTAHDRPPAIAGEAAERRARVQAAVIAAIAGLANAYRRHDPGHAGTVHDMGPMIRRWLGAQTFATRTGTPGLQIVDAHAARFGEFDDVQVMGLVDGDWPDRPRRNVFYPAGLLAQLEPQRPEKTDLHRERDLLRAARAQFHDLLGLARSHVQVSTFALESDAVVEPSILLDDLASFSLPSEPFAIDANRRVFAHEALALAPARPDVLPDPASAWARLRLAPRDRDASHFLGEAGPWVLPRVSVSRLEGYLKCPFQFYASNVLKLDEEPEDEVARSPLERGQFLHELFETFFHEWQMRGRARITPDTIDEARTLFAEICEPALKSLSPAEAGLERARLFGSAVAAGIADRVFAMEAERPIEIRRRLMEYELAGEFSFAGEDGAKRTVPLRAKIDRVDLLADGTFRLIDYKTKWVMDRKLALQLPIYSACVRTRLAEQEGRQVPVGEAMYLSFEGDKGIHALEAKNQTLDEIITAAEHRLVHALDDIAAGHYPPRPNQKNLCTMCAFVTVCRHPGGVEDGNRAPGGGNRHG